MNDACAIILARGGSKGLPGKNTAVVAGKPCIVWTIEAAQRSTRVGRVVVSSDDAEALRIADEYGCECVDRPKALAGDTSPIDNAARHAFESAGSPAVPVVILYANVPVRPESLIDDALQLLVESGCDSVQSYAAVGKYHPWWTVRVGQDGAVSPWEGEVMYHNCFRRQDLPAAHIPDGGVIALTGDALMCRINAAEGPHCFLGNDRRGIVTEEGAVIDIDSRIDQVVADGVLKKGLATESTEDTEKKYWGKRKREEKEWDGVDAELTHVIIGCAMRVHRELGPGLLESVYELCLIDELGRDGIEVQSQVTCDVDYKNRLIPAGFRMDLLVENRVVVEVKAVDAVKTVHHAQLMSYLRISGHRVGLLLNFNERMLKDGIKRIIL